MLLGDGTGSFVHASEAEKRVLEANGDVVVGGGGLDWGDLDDDGRPEVVATRFREAVLGERRDPSSRNVPVGAGPAIARRAVLGWGARVFDADNDGDLDIVVAGGGLEADVRLGDDAFSLSGRCLFQLNAGGGYFREVGRYFGEAFGLEGLHRGLACADLDRDHRIDLIVARLDGPPLVLWNSLELRRWLRLRLVSQPRAGFPRSPPEGIGARVEIEAAGRRQVRWLKRSAGYLSSSEATLHFGLGEAGCVDRLRIYWPSGQRDEHRSLEADREYVALEGGELR